MMLVASFSSFFSLFKETADPNEIVGQHSTGQRADLIRSSVVNNDSNKKNDHDKMTGVFRMTFGFCTLFFFLMTIYPTNIESFNSGSSSSSTSSSSSRGVQWRRERPNLPLSLPSKLLIGYTTTNGISKVVDAVRSGVNVVVWSFVEYRHRRGSTHGDDNDNNGDVCSNNQSLICYSTFDLDLARQTIAKLDEEGLDDVIHLVSFGGWNGPHLPPLYASNELYESWKIAFGDVFDGFDWDLEGHDDLKSQTNILTIECLKCMGEMSILAKNDGYIVGMAPAQSYLDIESSRFSRYLNLTDETRNGSDDWHSDFHYFGANCYAYLLSKYADAIDFVSIQFYESYSKAGLSCYGRGMPKDVYLETYVQELRRMNDEDGGMFVDFNHDPSLEYASRIIEFPISKLVFGFANGWGIPGDKVCFFEPSEIETTYKRLADKNTTPRGFMFWVIDEEGSDGVYFAESLNGILKIRPHLSDSSSKISST